MERRLEPRLCRARWRGDGPLAWLGDKRKQEPFLEFVRALIWSQALGYVLYCVDVSVNNRCFVSFVACFSSFLCWFYALACFQPPTHAPRVCVCVSTCERFVCRAAPRHVGKPGAGSGWPLRAPLLKRPGGPHSTQPPQPCPASAGTRAHSSHYKNVAGLRAHCACRPAASNGPRPAFDIGKCT